MRKLIHLALSPFGLFFLAGFNAAITIVVLYTMQDYIVAACVAFASYACFRMALTQLHEGVTNLMHQTFALAKHLSTHPELFVQDDE